MPYIPVIVACVPLTVSSFHGDVALSSFNTSLGAIVSFLCPKEDDVLVGNPAVQCNRVGQWNGTVPRCINKDDIVSTTLSTSDIESSSLIPSTSTTSSAGRSGFEVDTIVVLLWSIGGALLVALSVLLVCIMQSHKKARRERSALARARANPRHGGVNPSFTAYDEIWTWIPVVRENENQCRTQVNPSARESSANSERNLLSALRLPSYNEAVRNAQSRDSTSVGTRIPRPSVSTRVNGARENNQAAQNSSNVQSNGSESHYETIPADVPAARDTNNRASNNVTSVSVISTNVHSATNHPAVHQSSQYMSRPHVSQSNVHSPRIPRHPFARGPQRSARPEPRLNNDTQNQHSTNTLQIRHIRNPLHTQPCHVSNTSSHQTVRVDNGSTSEFVHSDRSAFANYRERTRRVNDVIRTVGHEELSPVPSGSRQSQYLQPRSGIPPSAPLASLDSVYF